MKSKSRRLIELAMMENSKNLVLFLSVRLFILVDPSRKPFFSRFNFISRPSLGCMPHWVSLKLQGEMKKKSLFWYTYRRRFTSLSCTLQWHTNNANKIIRWRRETCQNQDRIIATFWRPWVRSQFWDLPRHVCMQASRLQFNPGAHAINVREHGSVYALVGIYIYIYTGIRNLKIVR